MVRRGRSGNFIGRGGVVKIISIYLNRCRDCDHIWKWTWGEEWRCSECGVVHAFTYSRYEGEDQGLLLVGEEE